MIIMILYQIFMDPTNPILQRCTPTVKAWAERHNIHYHCDTEIPEKYLHYKHMRSIADCMRLDFVLGTDDDVFYVDGDIAFKKDFEIDLESLHKQDIDVVSTPGVTFAIFIKLKGKTALFEDVAAQYQDHVTTDPKYHRRSPKLNRIWEATIPKYNMLYLQWPVHHHMMSRYVSIKRSQLREECEI